MAVVKVDATNEDNFKQKTFKLLPKGRYLFEATGRNGGPLVVETAKSGNPMVVVECKCIDDKNDGEYRGITVFDNIAITPKSEWKLVHLALACGSQTKDDIKERGVDLELIKGKPFEAEVDVRPPQTAADGTTYSERNRIARYLFEPED